MWFIEGHFFYILVMRDEVTVWYSHNFTDNDLSVRILLLDNIS